MEVFSEGKVWGNSETCFGFSSRVSMHVQISVVKSGVTEVRDERNGCPFRRSGDAEKKGSSKFMRAVTLFYWLCTLPVILIMAVAEVHVGLGPMLNVTGF